MPSKLRSVWPVVVLLFSPQWGAAQVHRLAEMNTEEIRALDPARTVVLLPGGILEQHGPYLPSFADGYYNERLTDELAAAVAARPGWSVVVFPTIPLGSGGANEIGGRFPFPGTYAVRPETMRSVFMDLATEFGEQGFRWIFVVHSHGSPDHSRALHEAGDYFRDAYGGHMVHLADYWYAPSPTAAIFAELAPPEAIVEDGFTVHAGLAETSGTMYLRPDLVPATQRQAPSITGRDLAELIAIAEQPDWPGYFGAPRYATAELGEALVTAFHAQIVELALAILDGLDERDVTRGVDARFRSPVLRALMERSRQRDRVVEARQEEWLVRSARDRP